MDQSFGLSDLLPINPADDSINAHQHMTLSQLVADAISEDDK